MLKPRWIVAMSLLVAHGASECAQPEIAEARPAAPGAMRTTPQQGSESAVRRLLAEVAAGKPDYDLLAPTLAAMLREQLPKLQQDLLALGKLESVSSCLSAPKTEPTSTASS